MIFRKSLLKELTVNAASVFAVLLIILVSTQAINLLGRAAEGQLANEALAAMVGFWTLGFFPVLMILTVYASVLIVFTRMWRDHEMAVWLSAGVSLRQWLGPVLRFSVSMALLVAVVTLYVGPWADQRSQDYANVLKKREEISAIAPGVFKESSGSNRVYFIENYAGEKRAATNIFMQEMTEGKLATILAKSGYVLTKPNGERSIVLEEGQRYVGTPGQADYDVAHFKRYIAVISEGRITTEQASNRQAMQTWELLQSPAASHVAELAWRLSLPISCIILALLAIPLSYYNPRIGQSYNLVFALLIFFVYQNALTIMRNWVEQGKVGGWAIALVHLVMLGLAWGLLGARNVPYRPLWQRVFRVFNKV